MAKRTSFRAQERRSVRLGAALRDPHTGWVRDARVVDLHLFGAGLEMADPPEVGTVVLIELSAPALWDPLRLPGTVVWAKTVPSRGPARLGIRFDHTLPEPLLPLFDLLSEGELPRRSVPPRPSRTRAVRARRRVGDPACHCRGAAQS